MAKKAAKRSSKGRARQRKAARPAMLFDRQNYVLLLLGVLAVVIGYAAMRIENEVDGFISLYVAPLLILGGYLEIVYAILRRPKQAAAQ